MGHHIYRVVVRGQFDDLAPDRREVLLAEADNHDIFKAAYTKEGTFTYEPNLVAFQFRYEIRIMADDSDSPADNEAAVVAQAEEQATTFLQQAGFGHKRLRFEPTNMADFWGR